MKVICAGLGKTGTKSLAKALRTLGYTVFDWEEQQLDFLDHWVDVFNGSKPDVTLVYRDADAAVDFPCPVFFEEILEAFPEAKVILTVRDEESWVQSLVNQVKMSEAAKPWLWFLSPTGRKLYFVFHSCLYASLGDALHLKSTYVYRKRFRIHNDRVRRVVPRENLLEFNVQQGWEPLCQFLGCDTPNVVFPKENVKGALAKEVFTVTRSAAIINQEITTNLVRIGSFIGVSLALLVCLWNCWHSSEFAGYKDCHLWH